MRKTIATLGLGIALATTACESGLPKPVQETQINKAPSHSVICGPHGVAIALYENPVLTLDGIFRQVPPVVAAVVINRVAEQLVPSVPEALTNEGVSVLVERPNLKNPEEALLTVTLPGSALRRCDSVKPLQ